MENIIDVRCDAKGCGWEIEEQVDKVAKWHNAPCPSCGHKPVVSDEDMVLLAMFLGMRDLGLAKIGKGKLPTMDKPHIDVRINTRGLRTKTEK